MAEHTDITWTDHTFNPWIGCNKISPGCVNCYAEVSTPSRVFNVEWGRDTPRHVTSDVYWRQPILWDRAAAKAGRPALVFCASLADVFEDHPDVVEARGWLWDLIEDTPNLIWLLLTKRPENVRAMVPRGWLDGYVEYKFQGDQCQTSFVDADEAWPSNVWIGTTIENQAAAAARIPVLCSIPAPVRFLSCEPLLNRVDISPYLPVRCVCGAWMPGTTRWAGGEWAMLACWDCGQRWYLDDNDQPSIDPEDDDNDGPTYQNPGIAGSIDWVIVGGESGPNRRPFNPEWALDIRDQCADAGVPFFYKQGSDARAGADPLLDGKLYHNWPKEAQR